MWTRSHCLLHNCSFMCLMLIVIESSAFDVYLFLQIASIKTLTGTNYEDWRESVKIYLLGIEIWHSESMKAEWMAWNEVPSLVWLMLQIMIWLWNQGYYLISLWIRLLLLVLKAFRGSFYHCFWNVDADVVCFAQQFLWS